MRMLNYAWETSLYIWISTLLCGSVFGPCSNVWAYADGEMEGLDTVDPSVKFQSMEPR